MNNFELTIIALMSSLVVQVVWIFLIPTILILAAHTMWRSVPRWISSVVVITAIARVLTAIPTLLMHPMVAIGGFSVQQQTQIALANALVNWLVGLAFAIAFLAVAKIMKRRRNQETERIAF